MLALASAAVLLMVGVSSPANASAVDEPSNDTVTFSVLGDVGQGAGSDVTTEELAVLGVDVDAGTATKAPAVTFRQEAPAAVQAAATNNVLFRWRDSGNREVVLRSLPYNKILTKHNLTYTTPRVVTQRATRTFDAGTSWRYRLAAKEIQCDWLGGNCKVIRTVTVRTIVDFRYYDSAGTYGVVTAYCEGITGACPNFVKNALNQ
ncbi:hypothetical protein D7252_09575 [Microbacterium sp. CGR2]|nr:hypothetical protein D7252_09575 [Microbacterium sp. CGR2]